MSYLFDDIHSEMHQSVKYLLVILRLAVLFNRDRVNSDYPIKKLQADDNRLKLKFNEDWLDQFPLTRIDLEQENAYLETINFKLNFS